MRHLRGDLVTEVRQRTLPEPCERASDVLVPWRDRSGEDGGAFWLPEYTFESAATKAGYRQMHRACQPGGQPGPDLAQQRDVMASRETIRRLHAKVARWP